MIHDLLGPQTATVFVWRKTWNSIASIGSHPTLGSHAQYEYEILFKPGQSHANADSLSRLPLPETPSQVPTPPELILLLETLHRSPVSAKDIKRETDRDPQLSQVRDLVLQGWRNFVASEEMRPYERMSTELSVQDGCLLWGSRVVVPQTSKPGF